MLEVVTGSVVAPRKKKWWQTVPAIAGGVTAFLSAITGLVIALDKLGVFGRSEETLRQVQGLEQAKPAEQSPATLSPDAWLSAVDSQNLFIDQIAKGFYPTKSQGRLKDGRQEFRVEWRSGPAPCAWQARSALSAGQFEKHDADFTKEGFALSWKSEFVNESGDAVIQAIWTRCN